ncbi:hypothetical protein BJ742DRAFT_818177, partial [Cladochytrium replicatum]
MVIVINFPPAAALAAVGVAFSLASMATAADTYYGFTFATVAVPAAAVDPPPLEYLSNKTSTRTSTALVETSVYLSPYSGLMGSPNTSITGILVDYGQGCSTSQFKNVPSAYKLVALLDLSNDYSIYNCTLEARLSRATSLPNVASIIINPPAGTSSGSALISSNVLMFRFLDSLFDNTQVSSRARSAYSSLIALTLNTVGDVSLRTATDAVRISLAPTTDPSTSNSERESYLSTIIYRVIVPTVVCFSVITFVMSLFLRRAINRARAERDRQLQDILMNLNNDIAMRNLESQVLDAARLKDIKVVVFSKDGVSKPVATASTPEPSVGSSSPKERETFLPPDSGSEEPAETSKSHTVPNLGPQNTTKTSSPDADTVSSISSSVDESKIGNATCAICIEPFVEGEELRELPCTHLFHIKCVDTWLTSRSALCPLCRTDMRVSLAPATNAEKQEKSEDHTEDASGAEEGGVGSSAGVGSSSNDPLNTNPEPPVNLEQGNVPVV